MRGMGFKHVPEMAGQSSRDGLKPDVLGLAGIKSIFIRSWLD